MAISLAPAGYLTPPSAQGSSEFRYDFDFTGSRFQIKRVDLACERRRELRDTAAVALEEFHQRVLADDEFLDSDEVYSYLEDMISERNRPNDARRGRIAGWSRKSRSNMLRRVAGLDTPGHWGMLTLTLPGQQWWTYQTRSVELLKAFRKRFERHWGRTLVALWKKEFQDRGAFHYHLGLDLTGLDLRELAAWCKRTWHEVVCHPACPGVPSVCPPGCINVDHAQFGARLDAGYSRRVRQMGKCFAAYFAKHGVHETKEYQHRLPGSKIREAVALVAFMTQVPVPTPWKVTPDTERQLTERLFRWMAHPTEFVPKFSSAYDEWLAMADDWDHPGRWWGVWGVQEARTSEGEMTPAEIECARLLARKVMSRRTWRYVEIDGRTVFMRRSLLSLHAGAGFWLLMSNPSEFRWWFLDLVRRLVPLRRRARAQLLATVEEPGARPAPMRNRTLTAA